MFYELDLGDPIWPCEVFVICCQLLTIYMTHGRVKWYLYMEVMPRQHLHFLELLLCFRLLRGALTCHLIHPLISLGCHSFLPRPINFKIIITSWKFPLICLTSKNLNIQLQFIIIQLSKSCKKIVSIIYRHWTMLVTTLLL